LNKNAVLIFTNQSLEKLYRSIEVSWIIELVDAGEFKEGHCLKLTTSKAAIYTICCDTEGQKIKWSRTLTTLIEESKSSVV